jgi:hypothetical protein
MAKLMQDETLASSAAVKAKHIAEVVASYPQSGGTYALSRNPDGTFDSKSTIFPAFALWSQRVSPLPQRNAHPMVLAPLRDRLGRTLRQRRILVHTSS